MRKAQAPLFLLTSAALLLGGCSDRDAVMSEKLARAENAALRAEQAAKAAHEAAAAVGAQPAAPATEEAEPEVDDSADNLAGNDPTPPDPSPPS